MEPISPLSPKQVRLLLACLADGSLAISPPTEETPYPALVLTLEEPCYPAESE